MAHNAYIAKSLCKRLCGHISPSSISSWASQVLLAAALALPKMVGAYCPGTDPEFPNHSPNYYTARQELARSQYVVVGKVLTETWLGEDGNPKPLEPPFQNNNPRPWGFDPYSGAEYGIKVVKTLKGKPGAQFTLFSENSTARFWLEIGAEYLFFVTEEVFDQPIGRRLTIDTCGKSAPLSKAQSTIKQIQNATNVNHRG